jgi:hypothetical protein
MNRTLIKKEDIMIKVALSKVLDKTRIMLAIEKEDNIWLRELVS